MEVGNYLGESMVLAGIVLEAPAPPPGGYRVDGAGLYRTVEIPGRPGWVLLYLMTEVAAGRPGTSGESPGEASRKTITISN